MEIKLIIVWILGGLFMMAGSWIVGHLDLTVGVTQISYAFALLGSLVLFLLAGLCWISVAVATKGH